VAVEPVRGGQQVSHYQRWHQDRDQWQGLDGALQERILDEHLAGGVGDDGSAHVGEPGVAIESNPGQQHAADQLQRGNEQEQGGERR
jgi:hypothetical protein